MWDYRNTEDRSLADQTFKEMIKELTSEKYNPHKK